MFSLHLRLSELKTARMLSFFRYSHKEKRSTSYRSWPFSCKKLVIMQILLQKKFGFRLKEENVEIELVILNKYIKKNKICFLKFLSLYKNKQKQYTDLEKYGILLYNENEYVKRRKI